MKSSTTTANAFNVNDIVYIMSISSYPDSNEIVIAQFHRSYGVDRYITLCKSTITDVKKISSQKDGEKVFYTIGDSNSQWDASTKETRLFRKIEDAKAYCINLFK